MATITTKDVTRTREGRLFKFTVPAEVTREEAAQLQMDMGYHPAGYGIYGYKVENGQTIWFCGDSCD